MSMQQFIQIHLASSVDRSNIWVSQIVEFSGDGGDLFDSVLVSTQIALKGFVSLSKCLDFVQSATLPVVAHQRFFLSIRPFLMQSTLATELLCQMLKSFQPEILLPFIERKKVSGQS